MKSFLPLVLVAIVATLLHSSGYVAARELCPQESCVTADKCDSELVGAVCADQGNTCCSVVKSEYKTHCRHHGGECMDNCPQNLQRIVVDCSSNQVCCILI